MADRVQLNNDDVEQVVGGAYNFYYDNDGAYCCYVDGIGNFKVKAEARDRLTALKLLHKQDRWTAAQYVDALVSEGMFYN